ncbi:MAG: hypothetical protein ACI9Y7_002881 [Dokdonia sp.]|jgi:hypothetical protein
MRLSLKNNSIFYQHLGKLFYAIAISDMTIQDKEFEALQRCIQDYWTGYNDLNQIFKEDPSHIIEAVFEGVEAFELDGCQMYEDFVSYKKEHPLIFTKALNTLLMATAKTIAHAFGGIDASEQKILIALEKELYVKN